MHNTVTQHILPRLASSLLEVYCDKKTTKRNYWYQSIEISWSISFLMKLKLGITSSHGLGGSKAEHLRTALGNWRAYNFMVIPLANITQAYDEGEATCAMARVHECTVEDREHVAVSMILEEVTEEVGLAYVSLTMWCACTCF
jgi:hypothetical protein